MPLKDRKHFLARLLGPEDAVEDRRRVLTIPSLPVTHKLREGTRVRMRTMQPDENETVYRMFLAASETGQGYSVDDTLSLRQFRSWFLADAYNVVWEVADSGHVIAFSSIGQGPCARTSKSTVCDSNIVLRPEYQGRGIGIEIAEATERLARSLGYTSVLSDTPAGSHRSADVMSRQGYCVVGVLPNCANLAGHGIVDLLCCYRSIAHMKPFVASDDATHASRL